MDATRRGLLAGAAGAAVAGLAGCIDGTPAASVPGGKKGSRLAYVRVANWHEDPHTVHVLVQRAGEPVHWSSHDLPAGDDRVTTARIERSWAAEAGRFTVYVRLDAADEWESFDVGSGAVSCYGVEARVNAEGNVGIWYETSPPGCETTPTPGTDTET